MDLVLRVCDDYFFDRVWAKLVPLEAFSSPELLNRLNASLPTSTSKWSQLVSHLPHPPITPDDIALYTSASALESIPSISAWPRDYIPRQILSLSVISLIGANLLYFIFSGLSYRYIFNHEMKQHPRFLKNQVRQEIICSVSAIPGMMLLTVPWFQAEVMGYSKLYNNVDTYGYAYLVFSIVFFLLFTDYGIYWIHRLLHHPLAYKALHKPHHKWIVPTPFASYAFHPIDGYLQSIPYHLFVFLFPLHRLAYLGLFVVVNFWTILIHDSDMITDHPLETVINGPAHHTLHHLYFTVNYGQYFTWADRVGGSYRQPEAHLDPLLEVKHTKQE